MPLGGRGQRNREENGSPDATRPSTTNQEEKIGCLSLPVHELSKEKEKESARGTMGRGRGREASVI